MSLPSSLATTHRFDERIAQLMRELRLAIRFDRPSILLAVYQSELVRAEVETVLTERLAQLGQSSVRVRISEQENDVAALLAHHPQRAETVFFVSGLQWGGGRDGRDAYRALNLRREYFVEQKVRLVLWLTEQEAGVLPYAATDFWVFRHRTVEFTDAPQPQHVRRHARDLTWRDWEDRTLQYDTAAKIAIREQLLAELPDNDETDYTRADLLYALAPLYAAQGDYEKAIVLHQQSLAIAKEIGATRLMGFNWNGLGNRYRDLGRTEEALAAFQRAIDLDPNYATPHNGLGNLYRDLGRSQEALAAYQRAIDLDPNLAMAHNNLGLLYRDLGRNEEALAAFQRAIDLDPNDAPAHASLAAIYRLQGMDDAYQQHIDKAMSLAENTSEYNRACIAAIAGDVDEAVRLLTIALDNGEEPIEWVRQDPDFEFMRDDPRFQALVAPGA